MMTVKHRKTYTFNVEIDKNDEKYTMFRNAYDKAETAPFQYIEEIGDIIENELRPLIPFKKVNGGWNYRLNITGRDETIRLT